MLLKQGEVAFDGPTREAIARYRRLLADERSPDELAAGLREWGSGEARVVVGPAARRRRRRAAAVRRRRAARGRAAGRVGARTSPPPRLSLELRDDDGVVLGGVTVATADLGWDGRAGERELRFEIDRLPLAEGRFHLRCSLLDGDGGAAAALARRRGAVLRPSDRRRERCRPPRRPLVDAGDRAPPSQSESDDELPLLPRLADLMEIAPELQFKHYTLREAKIPAEALVQLRRLRLRRGRDLLRPRRPRVQPGSHRPDRGRGAARDALVRPARVRGARARLDRGLIRARAPHFTATCA